LEEWKIGRMEKWNDGKRTTSAGMEKWNSGRMGKNPD